MAEINTDEFVKECIANAKVAMNNSKFETAKKCLEPAYEKSPKDPEVLRMLGGVCALNGDLEESLKYYSENLALAPENGDNHYLVGNAYFLTAQYNKSVEAYTAALNKGCTEEILPKVYYQLGLICSIKGDRKAALVHFQQYEDTDPTGTVALDQKFLTERIRLYLQESDAVNALKYAQILLNIKPDEFKYYGLCFSLYMADGKYEEAEKMLEKAGTYSKLGYEEKMTLYSEKIAMYSEMSENIPDKKEEYLKNAVLVIREALAQKDISVTNRSELRLVEAEMYYKAGRYSISCDLANELVSEKELARVPEIPMHDEQKLIQSRNGELQKSFTGESIFDNEVSAEIKRISTDTRAANSVLGESEELLREAVNGATPTVTAANGNESAAESPEAALVRNMLNRIGSVNNSEFRIMPAGEFNDRLNHLLVNCYLEADDYPFAEKYASVLKKSSTIKYANFGYYVEALCARKLADEGKKDKAVADDLYNRAIARFKKQMFENAADSSAAMFRARLYAENGKYDMAEQIAAMLDDPTMRSLNEYISECRKNAGQ